MTFRYSIALITASSLAFGIGFLGARAQSLRSADEISVSESFSMAVTTTTADSSVPIMPELGLRSIEDARSAFQNTLTLSIPVEKIGAWMQLGYELAAINPRQAIEELSPQLWEPPYYDLRGTLMAEWMRRDPADFLAWAESVSGAGRAKGDGAYVATYHLAYLEPEAAIALLGQTVNVAFANSLRSSIRQMLVDINPERLWELRGTFGGLQKVIDEIVHQRQPKLAFEFWVRSGFERIDLPYQVIDVICDAARFDLYPLLDDEAKSMFLDLVTTRRPRESAEWILSYGHGLPISDMRYGPERLPFLKQLLSDGRFWTEANSAEWARIILDGPTELGQRYFSWLAAHPEVTLSRHIDSNLFEQWAQPDHSFISKLYLSLTDASHPLAGEIERYMLMNPSHFAETLAQSAFRDHHSPGALMEALVVSDLSNWTPELLGIARETVSSLTDEELKWQLGPSAILNAANLDAERIERFLQSADPAWITAALNSPEFLYSIRPENIDRFRSVVSILPPEQARERWSQALDVLFSRDTDSAELDLFLPLAGDTRSALVLASNQFDPTRFEEPATVKALASHPRQQDVLFSLAARHDDWIPTDKAIGDAVTRTRGLLEATKDCVYRPFDFTVAAIASQPPDQRLDTAKAVIVNAIQASDPILPNKLASLAIWSEAERGALEAFAQAGESAFSKEQEFTISCSF